MILLLLPAGIVAVAAAACAAWWLFPPDPVGVLRGTYSPAAQVIREPAEDIGPGMERWLLIRAAGDTVRALWRPASLPPTESAVETSAADKPWTIVMLGGLDTGARAATLLPDDIPVHALAMEWPWSGPTRKIPPAVVVRSVPAIRAAVLASPAVLACGVEAAALQPEVDPERLALLGASLGVPPTVAALRLTDLPRAVALIDGGADVPLMVCTALAPWVPWNWMAAPIGSFAARLVHPLEPRLHAAAVSHIPAVLVNATEDERLPMAAIEQLHAVFPQAERRFRADRHLRPKRSETIAEISTGIFEWLNTLDSPGDPESSAAATPAGPLAPSALSAPIKPAIQTTSQRLP